MAGFEVITYGRFWVTAEELNSFTAFHIPVSNDNGQFLFTAILVENITQVGN